VASDVLIVPNDRGGHSITIDGLDVSYVVNEFTVSMKGSEKPVLMLVVRADRVRMGLPEAIVSAVSVDVTKEC
jgi:hypothetical protein